MMQVTRRQIRWFRFRRSGLVDRFASAEAAAAALLGVQAQMPAAAAIALWNRVEEFSASDADRARTESRTLVRLWGQRNTVHLYRTEDWPLLHGVFAGISPALERRLDPKQSAFFDCLVAEAGVRLAAGEVLTYRDIDAGELANSHDAWIIAYAVFMRLVRNGVACHGPDRGARSTFVHRDSWLTDLPWRPADSERAGRVVATRYLRAYGPASAGDLAFWAGVTVGVAKRWIADAEHELVRVVSGVDELWCRGCDLDVLAVAPPSPGSWPVRLLGRFDPMLLATRDKSWLIAEKHYKKVWRPAAHVEAVVLLGGRIAATWRYRKTAKTLTIIVRPFAKLSKTVLGRLGAQARGLARCLDRDEAVIEVVA